jgi:hypothetical protein
VALSAINDFCNGLAKRKFAYVDKREVLWGTLAKIVERKALQRLRGTRWKKEVLFADLQPAGPPSDDASTRVAIFEPTDAYKEHVSVELKELIDVLPKHCTVLCVDGRWRPE